MGGLLCARNGGSVAMKDSTMAAQILRMDHNLMSGQGKNDDFIVLESIRIPGDDRGKSQRDEIVIGISAQFFSGEDRA
jgi:hypothetical protein